MITPAASASTPLTAAVPPARDDASKPEASGLIPTPAPSPSEPLTRYQLDIGPTVTIAHRRLASNTEGVHLDIALAQGFTGRAHLFPWLALTVRYMRSLHSMSLDAGALGSENASPTPTADMRITGLQGSLQPTWVVRPTLRVFATVGIGWSSVQVPAIELPGQGTKSTIRSRRGSVREIPLGLGISWWVLPRWIALSYEVAFAPNYGSSGDAYRQDQYTNIGGTLSEIRPMPSFTQSFYNHFTVALTL